MPYYNAGDYYGRADYNLGDYYQGDPGLFGSIGRIFGKVTQTLGGLAAKVLPGPFGAAVRVALPFAAGGSRTALTSTRPEEIVAPAAPMMLAPPAPGGIVTVSPHGTPVSQAAIARQMMALQGGGGMRRTHPNKSTYVTRGGGTSRWPQGLQVHPKGTEAVTSRRMNVANPRALRRGLRRLRGFAKLAHKVLAVQHRFKGGRKKKK